MIRPKQDIKELLYDNILQANSAKIKKIIEKETKIKEERSYQDNFRRFYEYENKYLNELKNQRQKQQLIEYSQYLKQKYDAKSLKQQSNYSLAEKIGIENKFAIPKRDNDQNDYLLNQEHFHLKQKEDQLINQKSQVGYNIINGEFAHKTPLLLSAQKKQRTLDYQNYLDKLDKSGQLRLKTIGIQNNNTDDYEKSNLHTLPLPPKEINNTRYNPNSLLLTDEDYQKYYAYKRELEKHKDYKIQTPIRYDYNNENQSISSRIDNQSRYVPKVFSSSVLYKNNRQSIMQEGRQNEYFANKHRNSSSTHIIHDYPDVSPKKDLLDYQIKQQTQRRFKESLDNQVNAKKQYQIRLDQFRNYGSQYADQVMDNDVKPKDVQINNYLTSNLNNRNYNQPNPINVSDSLSKKPFTHNVVISRRLSSGTF